MAVAVKSTEELTKQKKPLTRQRRVVVTGTSVVTLLGHDSDVFYNNLLEGVRAIEVMETLDKAKCVVLIGSTMGGMKSCTYSNLVLMQLLEDWEALWHAEHCHKETMIRPKHHALGIV
ncbi:hypothetical protein ACFXTH_026726 [Malus domestica]